MFDKKQIWQNILSDIELTTSTANFVTWFNNTYIEDLQNETVVISVPSAFNKEWLENKYSKYLLKTINKYSKCAIKKIVFKITPKTRPIINLIKPNQEEFLQKNLSTSQNNNQKNYPQNTSPFFQNITNLNKRYIFENLIVGAHNELAKAAGEAVADNPGSKYNPLFIYGGVGLGKTHILQAIGNKLLNKNVNAKVYYVTSEKFTNDFVLAIRYKKIEEFKKLYHLVDVLLIDDIQFIGGKERTQEQFFHIFNSLYQENKQIVLCSDRPPRSIATLEERLCSRFEGGMIVDIVKPDIETKVAILMKKAQDLKINTINIDVFYYIAKNILNNVRELEGALNKLIAYCEFKKIEPNLKNAQDILGNIFSKISIEHNSPNKIIKTVAEFYKIEDTLIRGKSRKNQINKPRQVVVYLLRKKLKMSFPSIGKELGNRDHTTIMYALDKVKRLIKNDPVLKQEVIAIEEKLV